MPATSAAAAAAATTGTAVGADKKHHDSPLKTARKSTGREHGARRHPRAVYAGTLRAAHVGARSGAGGGAAARHTYVSFIRKIFAQESARTAEMAIADAERAAATNAQYDAIGDESDGIFDLPPGSKRGEQQRKARRMVTTGTSGDTVYYDEFFIDPVTGERSVVTKEINCGDAANAAARISSGGDGQGGAAAAAAAAAAPPVDKAALYAKYRTGYAAGSLEILDAIACSLIERLARSASEFTARRGKRTVQQLQVGCAVGAVLNQDIGSGNLLPVGGFGEWRSVLLSELVADAGTMALQRYENSAKYGPGASEQGGPADTENDDEDDDGDHDDDDDGGGGGGGGDDEDHDDDDDDGGDEDHDDGGGGGDDDDDDDDDDD